MLHARGILVIAAEPAAVGARRWLRCAGGGPLKGRLSDEDIERMIQEAEDFEEEDKKVKNLQTERNVLESNIFTIKQKLDDDSIEMDQDDRETLEEAVQSALDWMDENPDADLEDLKDRRMDLEDEIKPILAKVRAAMEEAEEGEDDAGAGDDDYYTILGISEEASRAELRKAYRKLCLRYHPDKNQSTDAEARFKEVSNAYTTLSDSTNRRTYDLSQRWS